MNPFFLYDNLKDIAEQGAVLKHEALHIILKHIIQMRNPKFTDKHLYNIAADIGGQISATSVLHWRLPTNAIFLHTFKELNLPENDVAETYYELLMKARDKRKPASRFNVCLTEMPIVVLDTVTIVVGVKDSLVHRENLVKIKHLENRCWMVLVVLVLVIYLYKNKTSKKWFNKPLEQPKVSAMYSRVS